MKKHGTQRNIFIASLLLLAFIAFTISPVGKWLFMTKSNVTVISQLAYDNSMRLGFTIYIKENDTLVPFLVMTDNYNDSGNTLLLRKNIIKTFRMFTEIDYNIMYAHSYYPNSDIDKWLSDEYQDTLYDINIASSNILVPAYASFGPGKSEVETISRNVFLLSTGEIDGPYGNNAPLCGIPLKYFYGNGKSAKIAYRSDTPTTWILRSSVTSGYFTCTSIAYDGTLGICDVTSVLGIRPALCVASDTKVEYKQIDGLGKVFVINAAS